MAIKKNATMRRPPMNATSKSLGTKGIAKGTRGGGMFFTGSGFVSVPRVNKSRRARRAKK